MEKWQDIPKSESALCQPLPAGAPSLPQAPPAPSKPLSECAPRPSRHCRGNTASLFPRAKAAGSRPERMAREGAAGSFRWDPPSPQPPTPSRVWAHPQARRWEGAAVRGWERHVDSDCDLSSGVESAGNQREMGLPVEGSPRVKTRGGTLAP